MALFSRFSEYVRTFRKSFGQNAAGLGIARVRTRRSPHFIMAHPEGDAHFAKIPSDLVFIRQNAGWNAEPNAPEPEAEMRDQDLRLKFGLNYLVYDLPKLSHGVLLFEKCVWHRLRYPKSDGWYGGQCRYHGHVPEWGEFYEVIGDGAYLNSIAGGVPDIAKGRRHFLFYFRDEVFECLADGWSTPDEPDNALHSIVAAQ